ncbi:membrane protein FAM174B [Erythrolamprus reginae]|uniref:membrane protein FAM174B n=1 Tax=Erythrolamprus reginae TaxID=121349 RepID=UPI00396CC748
MLEGANRQRGKRQGFSALARRSVRSSCHRQAPGQLLPSLPFPSLPFPTSASSAPPPPLAGLIRLGAQRAEASGERRLGRWPRKEPLRPVARSPGTAAVATTTTTMRPAERACLLLAVLPAALLALAPAPALDGKDDRKISSTAASTTPPPPPTAGNHSGGAAQRNPVLAMLRDLPALKAAVVGACAASACLMACLLFRVLRSKRRTKKTRKYDIITTPAERVEMAPLNEEDDEDEDSTVFDIKYR